MTSRKIIHDDADFFSTQPFVPDIPIPARFQSRRRNTPRSQLTPKCATALRCLLSNLSIRHPLPSSHPEYGGMALESFIGKSILRTSIDWCALPHNMSPREFSGCVTVLARNGFVEVSDNYIRIPPTITDLTTARVMDGVSDDELREGVERIAERNRHLDDDVLQAPVPARAPTASAPRPTPAPSPATPAPSVPAKTHRSQLADAHRLPADERPNYYGQREICEAIEKRGDDPNEVTTCVPCGVPVETLTSIAAFNEAFYTAAEIWDAGLQLADAGVMERFPRGLSDIPAEGMQPLYDHMDMAIDAYESGTSNYKPLEAACIWFTAQVEEWASKVLTAIRVVEGGAAPEAQVSPSFIPPTADEVQDLAQKATSGYRRAFGMDPVDDTP